MDVIRVLLADDHTLFRKGLRSLLEQFDDLEIVGEAARGDEAVSMAADTVPDVILMDIRMPGISGIEATAEVLKENPHRGIILVSMHDDSESVFSGMRAGACGYVLKEADPKELRRAIEAASRGEVLLNQAVAAKLLQRFDARDERQQGEVAYERLTARELEVLRLLTEGLNNKAIATHLVLSEKTVKNHINNIFTKLRVNDRTQARLHALRTGLIRLPEGTG